MNQIEVHTQAQLDKAIKNQKPGELIVCLGGTALAPLVVAGSSRVEAWGSSSVEAWGSSSVVAWGSSRVVAWESSSVVARGSSSVVARGSSSVVAWGSSSVVAWESSSVEAWGSSRVEAWESSSVVARESSSVEARGSSRVVAWGSSRVVAWGSSRVEAWGSSRVVAWESSSVEAWGSSRVEASKFVAVHKHAGHKTKINGGVIIEVPDVEKLGPADWCDYWGVKVTRGVALLYKALDDDLSTTHARRKQITYAPGAKISAPDWDKVKECGNGLHACASPALAQRYNEQATRYVQVKVKVADIVTLGDKIKVPSLTVTCEVDRHGDPLEVEAAKAA